MSVVSIDGATGCLVVDGRRVFPIGLSNGPPPGGRSPDGGDALAEVASAGASFIRTGRNDWSADRFEQQISAELSRLDAAAAHGLLCWLQLGEVANLRPGGRPSANERLLVEIVEALKGHPALGAYEGVDEPANPFRPTRARAAGLVRAYRRLKQLDANHPLVIIQAPLGPLAGLIPYRPAFDITGADIYPVSYPPGEHSDLPNKDISVVGDVTGKMVAAAGGKPIWMTLQIAWSGVLPRRSHPTIVPRFPTLHEERFMAYQAIVHGARGLFFFGGQLTGVMQPRDEQLSWNWTFWDLVLRPLLRELGSASLHPALLAHKGPAVKTAANDLELTTFADGNFLHLVAVRRSATATNRTKITDLPHKHNGRPLTGGQVLFEYDQQPLPPPILHGNQAFRSIPVANNSFRDWFGPHDTHIYRFNLA